MHIGFTGTQVGMTDGQRREVEELLKRLFKSGERNHFHHGDCIGADAQAAQIAQDIGYTIHCHPPLNPSKRAFFMSNVMSPPKEYLERNHDIVFACDTLVATPKTRNEELRSGTWATVRFARKQARQIAILFPLET